MRVNAWKHTVSILLMMSLLLPLGVQQTNAAGKYVELEVQWEDGRVNHVETLLKDGVTYGNFYSMGNDAGLISEMGKEKTRILKGYQKRIVIHLGSRMAEVDGKKVDMGREPVEYISHLYVPIRFLTSALGGEVTNQDTKTGKITVTGLNNYKDTFYDSMWGYVYIIRAETGDLEITNVYTGKQHTIPLGIKDMNVNTHNFTFTFNTSPKNLLLLTIEYTNRKTGEHDLYTLVFKDQGLIRKSVAHGLVEKHESLKSDGTIQLIDDKTIRIIDDGTGDVREVIAR